VRFFIEPGPEKSVSGFLLAKRPQGQTAEESNLYIQTETWGRLTTILTTIFSRKRTNFLSFFYPRKSFSSERPHRVLKSPLYSWRVNATGGE
jgi:hypothetical protein